MKGSQDLSGAARMIGLIGASGLVLTHDAQVIRHQGCVERLAFSKREWRRRKNRRKAASASRRRNRRSS